MSTSRLSLEDLRAELERGKVYECSLRSKRWHLDGLHEGGRVLIDPRPAILETLLHELTHRLRPQWGERRVVLESRRLLLKMDDAAKASWWRRYQQIKRRSRPVELDPEDE